MSVSFHATDTMNVHRWMKQALTKTTHIESSNMTLTAFYGIYRDTLGNEGFCPWLWCLHALYCPMQTFTSMHWHSCSCPYAEDGIICITHVAALHVSAKKRFWRLMILIMTREQREECWAKNSSKTFSIPVPHPKFQEINRADKVYRGMLWQKIKSLPTYYCKWSIVSFRLSVQFRFFLYIWLESDHI